MEEKALPNNYFLFTSLLAATFSLFAGIGMAQVDQDASEKTKSLYANLKTVQDRKQFLFGQEFFNSFRYSSGSAHGDKAFSDSEEVTGAHPAVLGSDFHYYLDKSATERQYHTEAVKWAYQEGLVITFDWHLSARGSSTYEYQESTKALARNIVNDLNGDRAWLYTELDKVIDIINNDLVVDGENIPIVFRPFHEMNGGWFWWGSKSITAEEYKTLFQLTVDYLAERTNTVLFCWSPNSPLKFSYYPGDDYVDVLGLDAYEVTTTDLPAQLALIVDHAQANDKVAVFSETGFRNISGESPGDDATTYWNSTVLPAIKNDPSGKSAKIAWVLTWINSSWSFPYVPHSGSSELAKDSFIAFKESPYVVFSDEVSSMYEGNLIIEEEAEGPLSISNLLKGKADDVQLYPVPANNILNISLEGFDFYTNVSIYNLNGLKVHELQLSGNEITLNVQDLLKPGVYLLKVSDHKKTVSKKVLVN